MPRILHQRLLYWSTIALDLARGTDSPSLYVVGYARSGTNWMCSLVSDYMGYRPFEPWRRHMPSLGPHVFHMMRLLPSETARQRSIYIMRDGRDVMVSRYFETLSFEPTNKIAAERYIGHELTEGNIRQHLAKFIEFMTTYRRGCVDYKTHITYWSKHQFVTVRYENLLADTSGELRRVLREINGNEPDPERLEFAVKNNLFEAKAGRPRGDENGMSFYRKGIIGDWKNYFTPEAARVFDVYAGDLLVELGYERDHSWVDKCSVLNGV